MHKIDWARFKGNVTFFMDARAKSWSEYVKAYVDDNPDSFWGCSVKQVVADEWGKIVFDPSDAERDVLLRLMDAVLGYKDRTHFFQSLEGDFCMAEVNLAGRLERDEGLNAGDCQTLAHYHEWINEDGDVEVPEIPQSLIHKMLKYDQVPSIWSTLLC